MRAHGIPDADIQQIVWDNPVAFFAQSGRLDRRRASESGPAVDRAQKFETQLPCCAVSRSQSGR